MRLSAADPDACFFRVYDYPAGRLRGDLCWVDDVTNQVGVGHAHIGGEEFVTRVEQRKRVLIITALKWIALDLPEEDTQIEKKISIPELFGCREPSLVFVECK